jgi:hypothetical protein
MRAMFWERPKPQPQPPIPGRPTDDQAMTLLREKIETLGTDTASNHAVQGALVDHDLLRTLGEEIKADFDRPGRNGIKVFLCRTPTSVTAEIRINGRAAGRASEAMGRLLWPEVTRTAFARFYAVAVHPVQATARMRVTSTEPSTVTAATTTYSTG